MPCSKALALLASAAAAAMLASAPSEAAVLSVVQVPIDSTAIANDPRLTDYFRYDIQIALNNEHFVVADLKARITQGSFYIPNLPGSVVDSDTASNAVSRAANPRLTYDTFVGRPGATYPIGGTNVNLLGHSVYTSGFGVPFVFPQDGTNSDADTGDPIAANSQMLVDVSWTDAGAAGRTLTSGSFTIARLTLTLHLPEHEFLPDYLQAQITTTEDPDHPVYLFPEPSSAAMLAVGAGLIALRRHDRASDCTGPCSSRYRAGAGRHD